MKSQRDKGYLGKAVDLVRYVRAIRNRELLRVAVYITERCDSKCRICGVWRKKNPKDMPLGIFNSILDGIGKDAHLAILGGEPFLHPRIEDILWELRQRDCSYNVETNGIKAERILELVKKYNVPEVQVSCDGGRDAYKKIRGVDNYDNIVWLLERFSSIARVRVNYVICPWNTREDLLEVKRLCDGYGAELSVEVYDVFEYLDTPRISMDGIYKADDVQPFPRSLLLRLYKKWAEGKLYLPCRAVDWSCVVVPDGNVYLCTHKMVPLGNLNDKPLSGIWESIEAERLRREYERCNGCWSGCYRNLDVALAVIDPRYAGRVLC